MLIKLFQIRTFHSLMGPNVCNRLGILLVFFTFVLMFGSNLSFYPSPSLKISFCTYIHTASKSYCSNIHIYIYIYNIQRKYVQLDISHTLCDIIEIAASFIIDVVYFNEHVLQYIYSVYIYIAQSVQYC